MNSESKVLCAASAYEGKFYLNDEFDALPDSIKNELKIISVLYTQDVGGIFTIEYDQEGNLCLHTESKEGDYAYDEIGSVLKIKEMQREKQELFVALEMYYKVFFKGEDYEP